MAVFLDFEDDSDSVDPPKQPPQASHLSAVETGNANRTVLPAHHWPPVDLQHAAARHVGAVKGGPDRISPDRPNPNKNAMTEALGCYPYVASFLILFTLSILLLVSSWMQFESDAN